ncbi:MAG: protein kinase [Gemmatimonadales bacterium]|nr:protein kinase [Gemmatimonadales bacterium]
MPPELAEYEVQRELGRGGMGVVYLARERRLDRLVALKVLPEALAADAAVRERFLREARTAAQLSHPHIVPVFRADESDGTAWFAMGFVDGETLAERIRARGRLSPQEAVRALREAAWALAYAHARGVVHRDVKPENILLERATGRALLTDFGIARTDAASALTQDGLVMGSVHYMSPEQAAGEPLDGRSDLYALGVVGFLALSGRLPFDGAQAATVLVQHATRPAPPLASVAPDVPAALAAVIDQCLAKAPDARPATGEALAELLERALAAAGPTPPSGVAGDAVLSQRQAEQVWLRAAQLQAEAAQRIEARSRTGALAPVQRAPTDGYALRDVEAAAVEAGIQSEYVALAMAELGPALAGAVTPTEELTAPEEQAAALLLGSTARGLDVTRRIRGAPARVLEALGQLCTAAPHEWRLVDTIGGHPLDGGVMVFEVPLYRLSAGDTASPGVNMLRYRLTQLEADRLQLSLVPAEGGRATDVRIHADLRGGIRKNLRGAHLYAASIGGAAGLLGFGIGLSKKMMALAAAQALGPAALGLCVAGLLTYAGYRASYRGALEATSEELQRLLERLESGLKGQAIFGAPPRSSLPPPPPAPR